MTVTADNTLLVCMMQDMMKASSIYQPTRFWQHATQSLADEIYENGLTNFRALMSTLRFFVPRYAFPGYHQNPTMSEPLMNLLEINNDLPIPHRWRIAHEQFVNGTMQAFCDYRVFLATLSDTHPFSDQASESKVGSPVEQFIFDGKRYSRSFLNYLLGINFIKQHCDLSTVQTVLEIGGGFGSLGEILLGDDRNHCFYIDVDIPPTSYIASYYLQKIFGGNAIGTYDALGTEKQLNIAALRNHYRAIVLCSWQLPHLCGTIDLFVNFISFQEMEPNVVQNYLEQVDRLQTKYILLRNIREGKQKAQNHISIGVQKPIKGGDYDTFLPNYQLVAVNTVPFGNKTVDGFHSELRIYRRKT